MVIRNETVKASAVVPQSLVFDDQIRYWIEGVVQFFLALAALVSIATTVSIVVILLWETIAFFQEVTFRQFFADTEWYPQHANPQYGIWPLVCGTVMIAVGSAIIAVPLGLMGAIYLSEYSTPRFRNWVKPMLEILAGIPSVVLGYFALVFITPIIRSVFPDTSVFNAASACIAVSVMIVPTVISLSEDVLRSVPYSLREAAYALGSTKLEVTTRVVVPAAMSGIMAAIILAVSRAVGETMAVAMAAGQSPAITFNPLDSIQTMTSYVSETLRSEVSPGTVQYNTLFAVCMMLFLMTLSMNLLSQWILSRYREKYE